MLLATCGSEPQDRSAVPTWIPDYPGSEAFLATSAVTEEGWGGTAMTRLDVPLDEAFEFYRSELSELDYRLRVAPAESNAAGIAQISGFSADETHGVTFTISADGNGSQVVINFTEAD